MLDTGFEMNDKKYKKDKRKLIISSICKKTKSLLFSGNTSSHHFEQLKDHFNSLLLFCNFVKKCVQNNIEVKEFQQGHFKVSENKFLKAYYVFSKIYFTFI